MQILRYCFCGGIGVLCDLSLYYVAITLGLPYQFANAGGYLAGTLVSFVLNRKITFGVRDQVIRRLVLFLIVAGIGFLSSAVSLWILIDLLAVDALVAKLLSLPVVVVLQYSLNRQITFRQRRDVPAVSS